MDLAAAVTTALRHGLDALLPPVCLVCGGGLGGWARRVCAACWARAPRPRHPLCGRCGMSLPDIGLYHVTSSCAQCADWLPYLCCARAPFLMEGEAARMVHALKYGGWVALAGEMAEPMARTRLPPGLMGSVDGVVPVPLSRTRQRERGFNQAGVLASELAARRSWRVLCGVLTRTRHTRRQARLRAGDRAANVAGAFEVPAEAGAVIRDACLVLVDDVLTTGATAVACVEALVGAGARAVGVITFARARPSLRARVAGGGDV